MLMVSIKKYLRFEQGNYSQKNFRFRKTRSVLLQKVARII